MKRLLLALAVCVVACRPREPSSAEEARTAAAADSLTVAFGDMVAGRTSDTRAAEAVPSAEPLDPCSDRVRGDGFVLTKTTLVDVYLPGDYVQVGADKSERDAERNGYAKYSWRSPDNSLITISAGAGGGRHGVAMAILKECDLPMAGAQVHIEFGMTLQGELIRGVFTFPNVMALVFEGRSRSRERSAEALHALHTVFVSPRWGARP